jgi:hypothetical protein
MQSYFLMNTGLQPFNRVLYRLTNLPAQDEINSLTEQIVQMQVKRCMSENQARLVNNRVCSEILFLLKPKVLLTLDGRGRVTWEEEWRLFPESGPGPRWE